MRSRILILIPIQIHRQKPTANKTELIHS